jgi:hypothetical protein
MIPENIKSEHVLKALEDVERGAEIPRERSSEKYDLEYDNRAGTRLLCSLKFRTTRCASI